MAPPPVMTPEGQPNVRAIGLVPRRVGDAYHGLLNASWPRLLGYLVVVYFGTNALFACAYLLAGHAVTHAHRGSFRDTFFFSVQTMATIGYGGMAPRGFAGNLLVAVEAMFGLVGFAMVTGLTFAKFSRPTARVLFSRVAIIAPRDGILSFMLRMANERGRSAIVEATAHLVFARDEVTVEGESVRRFYDLPLVRQQNGLFALSWTTVHQITEASPVFGETPESLRASSASFIISVTGLDETVAQTVHARHAYNADDVRWGARFVDILTTRTDGQRLIDYRRFHDVVEPPRSAPPDTP